MEFDAAAQGPATDTAMPEAFDEDAALDAIFDKAASEPAKPEPVDTPVEEVEAVEEPAPQVDAPTELPQSVRKHWASLPEEAREAILTSQREMAGKVSNMSRLQQGLKPIQDVLTSAMQDLPALADMKPEEVAADLLDLAKMSHAFRAKPVETMLGLIKQHGLEQAMTQALSGQAVTGDAQLVNTLKTEIATLKQQLQNFANPEFLRQTYSQFSIQDRAAAQIDEFASSAEHWSAVEDKIPSAIQFLMPNMPQGTPPKDILKAAYELAVSQFVPNARKASQGAVAEAAPVVDPEKAMKALKAKSASVSSSNANPKPRQLTEDELMDSVWDKMNS